MIAHGCNAVSKVTLMGAATPTAVPPNMDCAAESSHCTTMVAMIGGVVETVTEPSPEGSAPPSDRPKRVFQA